MQVNQNLTSTIRAATRIGPGKVRAIFHQSFLHLKDTDLCIDRRHSQCRRILNVEGVFNSNQLFQYPTLNKYAIDPVKPIRIVVQNGNVTLVGVVNSQADKDVAGLRANGVPGVFKVTNDLQVANQQSERN